MKGTNMRLLLNYDCAPGNSGPAWTSPPVPPSQLPPWKRPLITPQIQVFGNDATMSVNYPFTNLVQSTAKVPTGSPPVSLPYYITLPNGNYVGQTLNICIPSNAIATTQTFLVIGTISGGYASFRFNNAATFALIQWDGYAWVLIGGNAQPSNSTTV
jgi:hypothetical protein